MIGMKRRTPGGTRSTGKTLFDILATGTPGNIEFECSIEIAVYRNSFHLHATFGRGSKPAFSMISGIRLSHSIAMI